MVHTDNALFDKNTVEFVAVSAEFCAYLERIESLQKKELVDTLLKLLPLLYLKFVMLPDAAQDAQEKEASDFEQELETYVTEDVYEILRVNLSELLAAEDDYLEVFLADMAYSDTPIKATISEDLADIYQDVRNFLFLFQLGYAETMHAALLVCQTNFQLYWGQKLVNTLRALHNVKYNQSNEFSEFPSFQESGSSTKEALLKQHQAAAKGYISDADLTKIL